MRRFDIVHCHFLYFKMQRPAREFPRSNQIPDNFILPVHPNCLPRLFHEIDMTARPPEGNMHALMPKTLPHQPGSNARLHHQIHNMLFQHARAHPVNHVILRTVLQDHRIDAIKIQQMPQHQARRPRPNDRDLRPHSAARAS